MTVKKTKVRFETHIPAPGRRTIQLPKTKKECTPELVEAVYEILHTASSPGARVERLMPHAERQHARLLDLAIAEKRINKNHKVLAAARTKSGRARLAELASAKRAINQLAGAKMLIDETDDVPIPDRTEFELRMCRAEHEILLATLKELLVPPAVYGIRQQRYRVGGGASSHGMKRGERLRRNEQMQEGIDRLCRDKGLSYNSACTIVARETGLTPDHVKRITKNPNRK